MHHTHRLLLFAVLLGALSPALAAREFLIDADWLAEHIEDDNLIVLEVRYHPHRYFTIGHIPGAVQVQRFRDLGDNAASPLMRFPSKEAFQATLRRWGVNDGSTLVIYDDASTALAVTSVFPPCPLRFRYGPGQGPRRRHHRMERLQRAEQGPGRARTAAASP